MNVNQLFSNIIAASIDGDLNWFVPFVDLLLILKILNSLKTSSSCGICDINSKSLRNTNLFIGCFLNSIFSTVTGVG